MIKRFKGFMVAILSVIVCLTVGLLAACGDKHEETVKLDSVTITNESALTAIWIVGEADRTIEYTVAPETFTSENTVCDVKTSNADVVGVDGLKLSAKSAGTAEITVTVSTDNESDGKVSKSFNIIVSAAILSLDKTSANLVPGEEISVSATTNTQSEVVWSVSDGEIAEVDQSGKIKALAVGETEVIATCNGSAARFALKVFDPVLEANFGELDMFFAGKKVNVDAKVTVGGDEVPADVTVSSSDDTVSIDGYIVTAVKEGSATIQVSATYKNIPLNKTLNLTVIPSLSFSLTGTDELDDWRLANSATKTVGITYGYEEYNFDKFPLKATVSKEGVITAQATAEGVILTQVGAGDVTVTVSDMSESVTQTFNVSVTKAPEIVLEDGFEETVNVLEGETVSLPVKAIRYNGEDISDKLNATLSDNEKLTLSDKKQLTVGTTGAPATYTVTYTVKDDTLNLESEELVITVNSFRNIIGAYNDADVKADTVLKDDCKYVPNADQKIKTTHGGNGVVLRAGFNIEPSKLYYAEATFNYDTNKINGEFHVGLGHYFANGNDKRSVVGAMDLAANGDASWDDNRFYIRNYDPTTDSVIVNSHNDTTNPAFAWYKLHFLRGIFDRNAGEVTIQTARSGNSFYMFVNGNFIGTVDYEYFRNKDTVPGIFGHKIMDNDWGVQDISGIEYYSGQAAQDKLDALLYANTNSYGLVTPYVFWNSESGYQASAQNKVTTAKNNDRGVHFDYTKDNAGYYEGAVSPNVMFNGDFTFRFDYKNTSVSSTGAFMQLQVRPRRHDGTLFQVGAIFNNAWEEGGKDRLKAGIDIAPGAATKSKMFVSNWDGFAGNALKDAIGEYPARTAPGSMWSQDYDNVDNSQGYRYILTFKKEEAQYTVKATVYSIADPSKQLTMTYKVSSTNLGNNAKWDEGFILVWNNYKCAGEYSNISWSYSVDESEHNIPTTQSAHSQTSLPEAISDDKRKK